MSKVAVVVEAAETSERPANAVVAAPLAGACLAEAIGTFIVILVGDGAVAAAVFAGAVDGWGVAVLWGLAVTFGIYVGGPVSGISATLL